MAGTSQALGKWNTRARSRLDELELVHASAFGTAPGRRWYAQELVKSMFVALLAQFQAYCRSLHDEAVDAFVDAGNPRQRLVLRELLTRGLELDRGNPRKSALGSDFDRFGIRLIPAMKLKRARSENDLGTLESLADLRNAIAHGDDAGIAAVVAARRLRLTLNSFRHSRTALERLARDLDEVVAAEIATVLGVAFRWQGGIT